MSRTLTADKVTADKEEKDQLGESAKNREIPGEKNKKGRTSLDGEAFEGLLFELPSTGPGGVEHAIEDHGLHCLSVPHLLY